MNNKMLVLPTRNIPAACIDLTQCLGKKREDPKEHFFKICLLCTQHMYIIGILEMKTDRRSKILVLNQNCRASFCAHQKPMEEQRRTAGLSDSPHSAI